MEAFLKALIDAIAPPDPFVRSFEDMSLASLSKATKESVSPSGIRSLYIYKEEPVRSALVELKSYRNIAVARKFAAIAYERLASDEAERSLWNGGSASLLLPVPMTRKKLRARGWNQAKLMADAVFRLDRGGIFERSPRALAKARETEDQVGMSRSERLANASGSCEARPDKVAGRRAVVIDDIATTGATLAEAKRALLASGAESVALFSIAR